MAHTGRVLKKGLPGFNFTEDIKEEALRKWFGLLQNYFPKIVSYDATIDLASIAATTWSKQTFTVTGLSTGDIVEVNAPNLTTGLYYISARVSAADTIELLLYNSSAGAIDEGAATWLILAIHK